MFTRTNYLPGTKTESGMQFKNICITGHTSGLGKGLYEHFKKQGTQVVGFSKDTGFDVSVSTLKNTYI